MFDELNEIALSKFTKEFSHCDIEEMNEVMKEYVKNN